VPPPRGSPGARPGLRSAAAPPRRPRARPRSARSTPRLPPPDRQAPKVQASKAAKALAAANASKGKKKKWSKAKAVEKAANAVLMDKGTWEKVQAEVVKAKLITVSTLSDRLRITGSLARAALRELEGKGVIRPVATHSAQLIYTRAGAGDAAAE